MREGEFEGSPGRWATFCSNTQLRNVTTSPTTRRETGTAAFVHLEAIEVALPLLLLPHACMLYVQGLRMPVTLPIQLRTTLLFLTNKSCVGWAGSRLTCRHFENRLSTTVLWSW